MGEIPMWIVGSKVIPHTPWESYTTIMCARLDPTDHQRALIFISWSVQNLEVTLNTGELNKIPEI